MNHARRKWLRILAAMGGVGAIAPFLIRDALAMGNRLYPQGMRKVQGMVKVNDQPAQEGALVNSGDQVTTGDNSLAIFVLGRDAYMLRSNSHLQVIGDGGIVSSLNLLAGKMLSVFGKGEKKILVPTATVGIRGTAVYAEVEPQRCYICTCYGKVEISCAKDPSIRETITSHRHDAPRYVYASGDVMIAKAPAINHTDAELFMLEALVGRTPAFYVPGQYEGGNSY